MARKRRRGGETETRVGNVLGTHLLSKPDARPKLKNMICLISSFNLGLASAGRNERSETS